MFKSILSAVRAWVVFTLLTGVLYPLAVTGLAQMLFPGPANGSVQWRGGDAVGSTLIGQAFEAPRYFSARPSATRYSALPSGGSNLAPTSPTLAEQAAARAAEFRRLNGLPADAAVPPDMVTASGSGLDPEITPEAAQLQAARVAQARGLPVEQVQQLVADYTTPPQFGLLGEARVNVLLLNLALDALH